MNIISQKSSIMDLVGPELSELFALEFAKIAKSNFVYTLATANYIAMYFFYYHYYRCINCKCFM